MSTSWKYMPILKWKRGERDALRYLTEAQWNGVVPLAEVQAAEVSLIDWRAELIAELKQAIPIGGAIGIDTMYVSETYPKQIDLLVSYCVALQRAYPDRRIIPVIHGALAETLPTYAGTRTLELLQQLPEVILRLRIDTIQPAQVKPMVAAVKKAGFKASAIHLVVDQFSIVNQAAAACETQVKPYLVAAQEEKCASVTVAGGSFPVNLMGIKQGSPDIPRVEWEIWTNLRKDPQFASLRYSDYAVTNPSRLAEVDPTQVNPSITIRYAAQTFWRLYKGGGFKKGKAGTLKGLCKLLSMDTTVYSGAGFSYGDTQYDKKAKDNGPKAPRNGTPWTWRRDATNHHIALTASGL